MAGTHLQLDPYTVTLYVGSVLIIVRSFFFGIYFGTDHLVIVSWFWTYRVGIDNIECILERTYVGIITRGDEGVNLFSSRFRIIGVRTMKGKERLFPVTVMPNRRSKATVAILEQRLGRRSAVVDL